jgi:Ferritin-like domain
LIPLQQNEVYLETLVNLLIVYNIMPIPPCNYSFPMNSTKDFFELVHVITSAGIGITIGLAECLAVTDLLFIRSASSIFAVESRHDVFFRQTLGKVPNPATFDTGLSDIWAYNLALTFVVPGSCPVKVVAPILPRLTAVEPTVAPFANRTEGLEQLEFTWDPAQIPFVTEEGKQLFIGWVNQLNNPVYTPLKITNRGKGTARLPPEMNGVAFAVITVQTPNNVNDLALATMAGPVLVLLS